MPDTEPKTRQVAVNQLPRRQSATFVSTFCNNANLSGGFFDVRLLFSEIVIGPPREAGRIEPDLYVEDKVSVAMSWEHAKALLVLLENRIKAYEEKNGDVRKQPTEITFEG